MPVILAWFLGPLGRWVGIAGIIAAAGLGLFTWGDVHGRSAYKAKIERQKQDAIAKGDKGRADALRKFDADGVPDYWFRD